MFRRLLGFTNPEIAFGFVLASVFWIAVLGWQAAYAPSEVEKRQCEETARKSGFKGEECKTLWQRTTTDPVAFFTLWLVVFTGGLTASTILLWRAGEKQFRFAIRSAIRQSRDMKASMVVAAEANRISRETLRATQRPWVREESRPASDFTWDAKGGQVVIATTISNIGNIPAQDTWIGVSIFPASEEGKAIDDIIAESKGRAALRVGQMLFPDGGHTQNSRVTITREKVEEVWKTIAATPGARRPMFLTVAVVVRYFSALDRSESITVRYYRLQQVSDKGEIPLSVFVDENVEREVLLLTHFWMPSYAD